MQLDLSHVSYTYPGATDPALVDVTAAFPAGWTCLVGDNGCGKTTLARIAAGLISPDSGTRTPDLPSAFCEQDAAECPAELEEFCCDWDSAAVEARGRLGVDDEWGWRWETLSGGQRKRLQVACALWHGPAVLVMDEPTNDLDAPSRDQLAQILADFDGVGILISHDRALVDRLADRCLVCTDGTWTMRPGGYTEAMGQVRHERDSLERERERAKREVGRLSAEASRRRSLADATDRRTSKRHVSPKDHDKRQRIDLALVSGKDKGAVHGAVQMEKRLARAQERLGSTVVTKRYEESLDGFGTRSRASRLIHVEEGAIEAGGFTLKVPELWVGPEDRVGISGPNGAGKSVLVRRLMELVRPGLRTVYIPQGVDGAVRTEALERLQELPADKAGEALSLVARLNSRPARLMDGSDTSPGETRKLLLALGLLEEPSLLVLDEPTNHLDAGSIEALERLIAGFCGAAVVVSHDRALLENACTVRWEVVPEGDGTSRLRVG